MYGCASKAKRVEVPFVHNFLMQYNRMKAVHSSLIEAGGQILASDLSCTVSMRAFC